MWRNAVFIRETRILNRKNVTLGQFPRKLRATRTLFDKECIEPLDCPEPCDGPCLMDQMLVPSCSWQKRFDEKMKESNRALMIGGGFFLVTIFAMRKIGYVRGYDVALF